MRLDDDGVTFRSTYDGGTHRLTPEIGGRHPDAPSAATSRWCSTCARRCRRRRDVLRLGRRPHRRLGRRGPAPPSSPRSGPSSPSSGSCRAAPTSSLRVESAERTVAVGFDGYAVGGLSVGESRDEMLATLAATLPHLPDDRPRYLMGLGDPLGMRGGDRARASTCSTACCPPGSAATARSSRAPGRYNLKRAENTDADAPARRRPAAARSAPGGPGPTCATSWWSTSPPRPGSSPSTTCGGPCAWSRRPGRPSRPGPSTALRSRIAAAYG